MVILLSKNFISNKNLLLLILAISCLVFLQAPEANAEYCFNGPNRPTIGTTGDVFWGNPPSPYPDVTLNGPGQIARMSLEGTFPGDDPFRGADCEGATVTVEIFPDGNPSLVSATVSGNLLAGSQIIPGNLGSWQWYSDWPHNLSDGRYRYKVIAINGFAISGTTSSNLLIITGVGPPLTCGLTANPSSGPPPLNGVDMTVAITSPWDGTAHQYSIDCTNDGTYEGITYLTSNPHTFVDACNYPNAGTYRPRGHLRNLATQQQANCSLGLVAIFPPVSADIICNGADSCSIPYNSPVTLSWSSSNATSCSVSPGGWTGTSGSQSSGNLTSTATYNLSCTGPGGSQNDSVTVTVALPPVTADLRCNNLDACSVAYNTSANLTWTSANATSCTVTPGGWTGTSNTAGQSTGNLTSTTTYNLSCTGPGGSQNDSVTVTVAPPPLPVVNIQCNGAESCSIANNTSANLTWTSTNTTSCTVTPGGWTGTSNTSGQSTGNLTTTATYSLSCTGPGGTRSDNVTVTVAPPPLPVVNIQCNGAESCSIANGTAVNFTWTSTNATSCTVTPGGWTGTSGSQSSGNLTATATYTLSCTGPGGTVSDNVTVTVAPLPTPTPTPAPTIQPQATSFTLRITNPFSGNINSLDDLFNAAITFLYFIAGPIVVIMIILAGLFFLFARDQADKINTAKRILTYALVGFAIILIGRGFIALIRSILALGS